MRNLLPAITAFLFFLTISGCHKEIISDKNAGSATSTAALPNTIFYFRGTINGVYKDWSVPDYKDEENLPYRFADGSGQDTLNSDCDKYFCKFMIEDVNISQGGGQPRNYISAMFVMASKPAIAMILSGNTP